MATISNRFLTVQGPVKMEILNLTAVNNGDTVTTNMARPLFAMAVDNIAAGTVNPSTAISGKTITITSTGYAGAGVCNILVFGF